MKIAICGQSTGLADEGKIRPIRALLGLAELAEGFGTRQLAVYRRKRKDA
jgi:hypothetical protein